MVLVPETWIGDLFDSIMITLPEGIKWEIWTQISEKCEFLHAECYGLPANLSESRAVYHCRQRTGPDAGREGIMKIRMQVPSILPASDNPQERAKEATMTMSPYTHDEISTLRTLNKTGCSVTPKFLTGATFTQDEDMPVPGGYMAIFVMEKVPGVSLDNFWDDFDREARDKIRAAFRLAMIELYTHVDYVGDKRLPNIHYDEENDKCYILDYEAVSISDPIPQKWSDSQYFRWGLALKTFGGEEEIW